MDSLNKRYMISSNHASLIHSLQYECFGNYPTYFITNKIGVTEKKNNYGSKFSKINSQKLGYIFKKNKKMEIKKCVF